MSRSGFWYCRYCNHGPWSYVLNDYCLLCNRRRTTDYDVDGSKRIAVNSSAGHNPQLQLSPQDGFIKENLSHSTAHECDIFSQEQSPSSTTHTDREKPLRQQNVAFESVHLQSPPKSAAAKRYSSPTNSQTSCEQTSPEHGIKSASTLIGSRAKKSKSISKGNILDDSRFGSASAPSLLEYYLFNQENPISEDLVTYAVRLPGQSSFSLETLEFARTPRRRPHSPDSRARIAHIRSNGGACADCKRKKKKCVHALQEPEATVDGDCTMSPPGVAGSGQRSAFAPRTLAPRTLAPRTLAPRTLTPPALGQSLGQVEEAPAGYRTSAVGARLPRQGRQRRRPTPRMNLEPETSTCPPPTDDQSSHVTSLQSDGSNAVEIRDRLPHIFRPFEVPLTIPGQGYVDQGHTSVDILNNPRLSTAFHHNEQSRSIGAYTAALYPETFRGHVDYTTLDPESPFAQEAENEHEGLSNSQFHRGPLIAPYVSNPEANSNEGLIHNTIDLRQVTDDSEESPWLPLPMYQGTIETHNDDELFNMACILPPQGDSRQQPASINDRENAFLFDEGFIPSTAHLQLNAESTPLYSDSALFDLISAENEAGYSSQYLETGLAASQFESYRLLGDPPSHVRSQLGDSASERLNPWTEDSNSTRRSESARAFSSGSILTPTSSDTVESLDPELLFDF